MIYPKSAPLLLRALLLSIAVVALAGCDQIFQDRAARAAERADKKSAEGDFQGALLLYEQALDGSPKSADLHFKMGLILDDKIDDPIGAIYHFRRYLALAPNGSNAKDVPAILKRNELKLLTSLNHGGTIPQKDAASLKNQNLALAKQNAEIKEQLRLALQGQQQRQKGKTPEPQGAQKPIPPGAKTYVVARGDTLASISRKFYKNPGRWKDIQDANFNMLEGTAKLKTGMTLMIP